MSTWKNFVRRFFTFNKRERQGLFVLLLLLLGLLGANAYVRLKPRPWPVLTEEQKQKIAAFEAAQQRGGDPVAKLDAASSDSTASTSEVEEASPEVTYRRFDPNEVSQEDLMAMGLEEWRAASFVKYRSAGAHFEDVEALRRVNSLPHEWLDRVTPYLDFPKRRSEEQLQWVATRTDSVPSEKARKSKVEVVELNTADSAALVNLPWVGGYYASEIVKLRESLGGFRSYDQLLDIYKIREETMESIAKYSTLDTHLVSRININECDVSTLGRHPYISWRAARSIVNYRKQHGRYASISGIMQTDALSDSTFAKISPYLRLK